LLSQLIILKRLIRPEVSDTASKEYPYSGLNIRP